MAFTSSPTCTKSLYRMRFHSPLELRERDIARFFFFDFFHIEVCFTEELGCFELLVFLNVHSPSFTCSRLYKVTCSLSTYPVYRHIGYFGCRNKVVHILTQVDAALVSVAGHAFLQLNLLAKNIR